MTEDFSNKSTLVGPISQAVLAMVAVLGAVVTFVWFIMSEANDMKADAQEIQYTQQNLSRDFRKLRSDFDEFSNRMSVKTDGIAANVHNNTESIEKLSDKVDGVSNTNMEILSLLNNLCLFNPDRPDCVGPPS